MVNQTINPDTLNAVQRMQDYIEEHLQDLITLKDLANAAGYSPFHASRLFKELAGKTPFDYIRALRLSKAALQLRDGDQAVVTVALDFVFASHEGFTRAFSRQFGLPPREYRQKSPPIRLFMPYKVKQSHHAIQSGENKMDNNANPQAIFVQVIERPSRKLILLRGIKAEDYYAYCEEVGCDTWSILCSVKEALYEPVGLWLPEHLILPGTSRYAQGVEVPLDYDKPLPEGFELIELPACKMMVFQGEPYDDEVFETAISSIWEHIKKFDPTLYGYRFAPESAPRIQLEPLGYRGYIEALPVVSIE
ncbi:MAG: AraC family transcriptional regulator [Anaerolineaceae bacterium]|nr:AraC family transcriptional regulator [Anaerolineaceae bacterium]